MQKWRLIIGLLGAVLAFSASAEGGDDVESLCMKIAQKLSSVDYNDCINLDYGMYKTRSRRNMPLLMREYKPAANKDAPKVLFLGGIHGDEFSSVSATIKWQKTLDAHHSGTYHWLFLPLVNPDGLLRKKSQRMNDHNVDLNRNFPPDGNPSMSMKYWKTKESKDPRRYPGTEPASEPETKAIMDIIKSFRPDVIVSVHAPYDLLDFDGEAFAPEKLGSLDLKLLGTYPGSLGNYAWLTLNIPVITIELPNATLMPADEEINDIWVDFVRWLKTKSQKYSKLNGLLLIKMIIKRMEYDNEKTVIALSLMSMVATSYAVSLASPDQAKFNSAVKAFRVNQNGEALKIFTELYKDYPQNQQIKNNYAVVLFATGKIEQAEEVLSSVIENDKEVNIAFKNLNKIYDYAAAKAYSNALGTEKEVQPQKLQIIEALTLTGESKTPEINQEKPLQVADNSVNTKGVESKMQTVEVTKPVANPISNPVLKPEVPVSVSTPVNVPVKPTTAISKEVAPVVATTAPVAPATPVLTPEAALAIITKPIQDWVAAWSKGDLKAYLDFYTPKYSPDGDSHKSWLLGRKLRISPAKQIQVQYTDLVVVPSKSIDTIEVHFKQSYKADKYQDNTTKRMVWKKEGDKWLIHKEISQ